MGLETSFGRWLRARRRVLDLTQDDLARQVGCSVVTIRKLEADERRPSRQIAERLADSLQIAEHERAAMIMLARAEPYLDAAPAQAPELPLHAPQWPTSNLPTPLTRLIGRKQDLAAARNALMRSETRLLTLIGPPGIGKTRLSIAVAHEVQAAFTDGAYFVALAPIGDPAAVLATIGQALGVKETAGQPPLDQLKTALRAKRALLLLDNFEQVLDAAQLVAELLEACPGLKALVTSRAALHVRGERLYGVPPLLLPDLTHLPATVTIARNPAVVLFMERAQAVMPDFALTEQNAPAVAAICVRLDGLPLAIELAATRIKLFSPEALLTRLEQRLAVLIHGARDLPARQQTLRNTIDWSYNLLDADEQVLFRRLAVFVSGCTLEATEAVCGELKNGHSYGQYSTLNSRFSIIGGVASLVDKSLLRDTGGANREPRFGMFETIREYALERLEASSEADVLRRRHAVYFLRLAEQAERELIGPRQVVWLSRVDDELNNIRAALEWALESDIQIGLRLASTLMRYWQTHSPLRDGIEWLAQLLRQPAASAHTTARAKALTVLGYLKTWQNEFAAAQSLAQEGLMLYRELDDQQGVAFALLVLGLSLCLQDDFKAGRGCAAESLALYKTLGDKSGMAEVLAQLGSFMDNQDYARARAYLEESLALRRELGHVAGISRSLRNLGWLALRQGDFAAARPWLEESLAMERGLSVRGVARSMLTLGELALRQGDYEQAQAYLEESLSWFRETGQTQFSSWALVHLGYVALRQGDQARAHALFVEGQGRFKDTGSMISVVYTLEGLASLAVAQGQPKRAVHIFAWADAMRPVIGDTRPPVEQADVDRDFAIIRGQLDEAAFAAAWAEGQAMSLEQVIGYALGEDA